MSRWAVSFSLIVILVSQGSVLAFCPSNNPNEILCEDFDTYCTAGQYPGGAGVQMGTKCAENAAKPADGDDLLRAVWNPTSTCAPIDNSTNPPTVRTDLPIPQLLLDNSELSQNPGVYYANSRPFAARSPSRSIKSIGDPLPQHTFKDWSTTENNFSRFITNRFGDAKYKAVVGTDQNPLVLTFMLDSQEDGKIFYSNGYIELGYGNSADYMNRANTDYALSPDCAISCNGNPQRSVKYPMICDLWNPVNGTRFVACPNPTVTLPPVRNAIAIGLLPMIHVNDADKGPCYCGSTVAHGGQNIHPVMFNGQVWYDFRNTTPVSGCVHTVTDMNGNPATMPLTGTGEPNAPLYNGVNRQFVLLQAPLTGGTGTGTPAAGQPHNWLTVTIYSSTVKVKLFKVVTTISLPATQYMVTDELAGIPLAYSGPFDSLRLGVGPGCELASDGTWDCASGSTRSCLAPMVEQGKFAEFDDILLYGGKGWTPAGACCLAASGGACVDDKLPGQCADLGGTTKGGGTLCSDPSVYCCPTPYADADGDSDVDAEDFAALQVCYTGNATVSGKCSCFDRNGDKKVDQTDVALFANCATGPGISVVGECP